ncbi:MAG: class I adenylate-forming enzyme family protein [Planctomycetota bacterium]|jgi:long-chain acyl-CoA synthetase
MQTEPKFRTLIDLFNQSLAGIEQLDKECLEIIRPDRQESLTFGRLRARARDFAVWLIQRRGIAVGDKVAILGKNRADWDVALWGVVLAGGIPVLIDPDRPVEGVVDHITHTEAPLIVMADDYQDAESRRDLKEFASGRDIGLIEMTVHEKIGLNRVEAGELLDAISPQIQTEDTAVILCTSGTTGDPREVELTHANLGTNLQGTVKKIDISSADTLGHILPPHHSFGFTVGKLLPFCAGAANVYTNKYREVAELIRDKNVTIFIAVPALFTMLAKNVEEALAKQKVKKPHLRLLDRYVPKQVGKGIVKKLGWGKIRFFLSGSAPMPSWAIDVFWRRGILLYEGYGTTENSPVYGYNDSVKKLGSVGKPIDAMWVKIVSEEFQELPSGERGEIALGGPCIMKGYYKNPEATQAVIRTDDEGVRWLLTGDLGHLDENGNLYITGRKKYVIVLPGGKNVNPERVESALSEARFVNEVLVVPGFWEDSTGIEQEAVRAIVRPAWDMIETHADHCSEDLLKQPKLLKNILWKNINECQQNSRQLSNYERIKAQHLEIRIEEFHKTSTGKIKREAYMKT